MEIDTGGTYSTIGGGGENAYKVLVEKRSKKWQLMTKS
jgi:hypothetical protein